MVKLQRIIRKNGTYLYSLNIPISVIDELNWKKGDLMEVTVSQDEDDQIIIRRVKKNDEDYF